VKLGLDVSAVPASPAGAGRYICELARRLPAHVERLTLATRRGDLERWAQIAPDAIARGVLPDPRVLRIAYEAARLGRSPVVEGCDVWHSPHYTMPGRSSRPVVVTIHDMTFFTHPEYHERAKVPFFTRAIRRAHERAACLVVPSQTTASELDAILGSGAPVVVAHHGVDLERFTPGELNDEGRPFILFVGTLEPRKGVDVLLSAFAEIGDDDREVELVLVGQDGWGIDATNAAIESHRHRDRIRRLGFVEDAKVVELMRTARVVAYPSRGEGFGLPVLEALACGALVVTSADSVMGEVAGDAADLVAAGEPHALAAAIVAAFNIDADERTRRRERARTRASQFTWENSIERHLAAYGVALDTLT
jgi:glycosyltransferase involved in cell wall biosynthesis